mgnify:CR=1 FL=1
MLIEAVVSHSCPLVGQTIREGGFRGLYHAVVLAVARDGARIRRKIGDMVLQPGDTLLLNGKLLTGRDAAHDVKALPIDVGTDPIHRRL